MNKTITTPLRRSLRHATLALCALVGLVAASCTADPFDGTDPNAGTNPDGTISFAVSPRPGFTEAAVSGQGTAAPATRAEQTPGATRWEEGDILWLIARFFHNKQDYAPGAVPDTIHVSALKYDGAAWRYLTVDEAADLHTANIPNFVRLLRWPPESVGWSDPGMKVTARYAGTGTPDTDGIITITPQGGIPVIPAIVATNKLSVPGEEPVSLQFSYFSSRIRIPAGYAAKFNRFLYLITFTPSNNTSNIGFCNSNLPAQQQDTDVFLSITGGSTVTLTRDGVSYSFAFPPLTDAEGNPLIDEDGNPVWNGASYTLTPYTNGTQTPVAGYDLTVANETELRELARAVNAGEKLPNGKPAAEARVLQTADIHLTKEEWVPIGNGDKPFRGAYNGDGHEISGLTITKAPQPDAGNNWSFAGLFGYAGGAVLTGIRLREVEINIPQGSGIPLLFVGSVAGRIYKSTLSLCTADGTVNAGGDAAELAAGGIAGYSQFSTISRCRADVETKAASTKGSADAYAGGITGWNGLCNFILSCESGDRAVTAEGSGKAYAGGIAGFSSGESFIAFCRTGKNVVTARNGNSVNYAGGLVGENSGFLRSCYSRATAGGTGVATPEAGAIVGLNSGSAGYCYGTGTPGQGTSGLAADPDNIVYNTNPKDGDIHRLMTSYQDVVESVTDIAGTIGYPYTTHYNPSATPAHGIEPLRVQWTSAAWKDGTTTLYPEIDMEYEGK